MKIISWNLNGLLSCAASNAFEPIAALNPDVACFQEIRTKEELIIIEGYNHIWNHADREKFSGTVSLAKTPPTNVSFGFGDNNDNEGRLITMDYGDFYLINAYMPNSQLNLKRRAYRLQWDYDFYDYISNLIDDKPLIICGDFNTTRNELDIFEDNSRMYWKQKGIITDERANLEMLIKMGLVDVFREFYPTDRNYTWWSNRRYKRNLNHGWRLDYFLVSNVIISKVISIKHLSDIEGSDHCPIMLEMCL